MYQGKVHHPLSKLRAPLNTSVAESMWKLFVAIGPQWELADDPEPYRLRFTTFMKNRIALNPLYADFYAATARFIDEVGETAAYAALFAPPANDAPPIEQTMMTLMQQYVSSEFIAMRLALGGFKVFGAVNYCGYFGGANIQDEPVPYRTLGDAK